MGGLVQLREARRRHPKHSFSHGDVCALRYEEGSFQLVSTVFTLRNFPDLFSALQQMVRVTAPGGSVVILDAFPPQGVMRFFIHIWLNYIMPPIASFFMCVPPSVILFLTFSPHSLALLPMRASYAGPTASVTFSPERVRTLGWWVRCYAAAMLVHGHAVAQLGETTLLNRERVRNMVAENASRMST
jgi:SAM-dependent methyltransferase